MRLMKIGVPVVAGLVVGYIVGSVVGSSSRDVVLAPPDGARSLAPELTASMPADSEVPLEAIRGSDGADGGAEADAAAATLKRRHATRELFDREHRTETYRRLLRPIARKEFLDGAALVGNAVLNPEQRSLTDAELAELDQIIEAHRAELLEAMVVRNELHDDILEGKLLANDVVTADPAAANGSVALDTSVTAATAAKGRVLSTGILNRGGKSMSYEIRENEHPEYDATYDIEVAIKQELEYEVKEFFATLPSR